MSKHLLIASVALVGVMALNTAAMAGSMKHETRSAFREWCTKSRPQNVCSGMIATAMDKWQLEAEAAFNNCTAAGGTGSSCLSAKDNYWLSRYYVFEARL